ncbi:MAG TPA: serine hydrolase domain-containing protein [Gemmatimonadaceae bacterium]|nr:serine hydrolase domain-containing protein [Gemmatimonadaceae bacterium]
MRRSLLVVLLCLLSSSAIAQRIGGYDTPALLQFNAWLSAFNSGSDDQLRRFLLNEAPSQFHLLDRMVALRRRTGGFDARKVILSTDTRLTMLLQERVSDQFAGITLDVEGWDPHRITRVSVGQLERPREFAIHRLRDAQLADTLRARLRDTIVTQRFAGAILIRRDGRDVFAGATDTSAQADAATDAQYAIGSLARVFTAVATMQLVQAGRLRLGAPFAVYLHDVADADFASLPTIHQLLTRTAAASPADPYAILANVIESVSGIPYADYVRDHILVPAGMRSTVLDSAQSSSTAHDLTAFADALLGHRLLDSTTTELMITGKVSLRGGRFGYGVFETGSGPQRRISAGGAAPGANVSVDLLPASRTVVVVLANADPPAARLMADFIVNRLDLAP